MATAKSTKRDTIINVLLLLLLAGVLAWRYDKCKKQEQAAQESMEKAHAADEQAQKGRTDACLRSVPEAARTPCIRCTCQNCLEEFETCAADKECSAMSVATMLAAEGSPSDSMARTRYERRALCMFNRCKDTCVTKP